MTSGDLCVVTCVVTYVLTSGDLCAGQNAASSWFVDGEPSPPPPEEDGGGTLRADDGRLPVQAVTQTDKDALLVVYDDRVKVSRRCSPPPSTAHRPAPAPAATRRFRVCP